MKAEHKPGYTRPRSGEKRRTRQPLKFDRLPAEWQEKIFGWLREKSVPEVARLVQQLEWEKLDAKKRALFRLREGKFGLQESALYRVRDLRIEQVERGIEERGIVADKICAALKKALPDGLSAAVQSALSDIAFRTMQASKDEDWNAAREALTEFGELLVKFERNEIRRSKVETDREKLKLQIEEMKRGAMKATKEIEKMASGESKASGLKELAAEVRKIYEGH